jgi:hypothetical protein
LSLQRTEEGLAIHPEMIAAITFCLLNEIGVRKQWRDNFSLAMKKEAVASF